MAISKIHGTAFERSGPTDAASVVLVHGLGLNRACWQWSAPALLEAGYQVIAYDLYGHGESDAPARTPNLTLFSQQLLSLLDELGIEKVAIAGFSLGGMIARRFAQDHPERTAAIAILHSPHERTREAQQKILDRVVQARQIGPASTVEAALERWFTDRFRLENPNMMDLVRGWILANDPAVYHLIYQILADGVDEITAPNPPIGCPALILTGDEDYGNGPEMAEAIAAEIPDAELHILPGLRHMALAENPDAVNQPLVAFLGKVQTHLSEPASPPMADDEKRALRNAFGAFPTGVTIVTTRQADGTPRGFTANSFTSVSLDPPILLICIAKTAHSCDTFTSADHFTVNILGENQKDVSGLFASRQPDKFDQTDWYPGHANMPVINKSLASFICGREKLVSAGDHIVLFGRVEAYTTTEGAPLGYHSGAYFSVGAEDPLVNAAARAGNVHIGAVLRKDQAILLTRTAEGDLSLPYAPDGKLGHEGLMSWLVEQGFQPDPQNLYAVYEDNSAGKIGIFYHGTMHGPASGSTELVPIGAIPFERLRNPSERSMLQRYAKEYQHGSFGIYQGNQDSGTVHYLIPNTTHAN